MLWGCEGEKTGTWKGGSATWQELEGGGEREVRQRSERRRAWAS